jgi:uncharacterized membrane protein
MVEFTTDLFINFGSEIIFLHILSAVIWVGGMIAVRVAVHPAMQMIATPEVKISRSLNITRNLFHLVIPFMLILVATGVIMIFALGHRGDMLVHIKEGLWTFMVINFIAMYIRRRKAEAHSRKGTPEDLKEAKKIAHLISNYMLPVNIILGVVAIYIGGLLRGL